MIGPIYRSQQPLSCAISSLLKLDLLLVSRIPHPKGILSISHLTQLVHITNHDYLYNSCATISPPLWHSSSSIISMNHSEYRYSILPKLHQRYPLVWRAALGQGHHIGALALLARASILLDGRLPPFQALLVRAATYKTVCLVHLDNILTTYIIYI